MNVNPLLALVSGLGAGVEDADQRRRLTEEQAARDAERRASRALQQIAFTKDLRDLGYRPQSDTDIGDAAGRSLAQLSVVSTPAQQTITMPAPRVAAIPGQSPLRNFAESSSGGSNAAANAGPTSGPNAAAGVAAPTADGAPSRADQAMKQLIVARTFQKPDANRDASGNAPPDDGVSLTAALHPTSFTDPSGQTQRYVQDASITPEARELRQLAARGKIDRENDIARATAQEKIIGDREAQQQREREAATVRATVAKQYGDYNTLRATFGKHPLAAQPFDVNTDYTAALLDARGTAHDVRVATAASDRQKSLSPVKVNNILTLQSHFNQDKAFQDATQIAEGYQKVAASAQNASAAGDLSLLYGYNKMLDPGSAVREGEFATVAKSGSLPEQIRAAALRVSSGQRLTPEQRQDFLDRAKAIALAQRAQLQGTIKRYATIAKRHEIDPTDIVSDPFEVIFDTPPTDARAPGKLSNPDYLDAWLKANPPGTP